MAARAIGIGFQGVIVGLAVHMRPAHPLLVLLAPHQNAPLLDEVAPQTHGPRWCGGGVWWSSPLTLPG